MEELKVTKENVLSAAEQSPMAKSILKRLHPEAFKEEFEVGEWYIGEDGLVFFITEPTNFTDSFKGYGFGDNGKWFDSGTIGVSNERKATPQEVEEALIKEAKKRGFKEGVRVIKPMFGEDVLKSDFWEYSNDECKCSLMLGGSFIFLNGVWATIIDEPKTLGTQELIKNVVQWGNDKNLIKKENSYKQFAKVVEEVAEIGTALNNKDKEELIDAIGDSAVTLILLAAQNNLDFKDCLESAYNVIKERTGETKNGVFVKD